MENKTNNKVFVFFPEVQPTFGEAKGSANRMENKTNNEVFVFFPHLYVISSFSVSMPTIRPARNIRPYDEDIKIHSTPP